jgi:acid phosphatase
MQLVRPFALVLVSGLLAACAAGAPKPEPAPTPAPAPVPATPPAAVVPVNPPNDQLYALAWFQTSIEFQGLTRTVYAAARGQLGDVVRWHELAKTGSGDARAQAIRQLADWNAMAVDERLNNDAGQPLAIILDADETVVDNSPYQVRRMDVAGGFDAASWSGWVAEARARAIPGSVAFTQWAAAQGIAVFFVSNRDATAGAATQANLRALGFPLPEGQERVLLLDDSRGFGRDKVSRRQLVDRDFRVIGVFGDNIGDFIAGIGIDAAGRERRLAPYADWWGSRWYALPNPLYGSWVDAVARHCPPGAGPAPRDCMRAALRRE